MSDKMPMVAIDKVDVKFTIPVTNYVKLDGLKGPMCVTSISSVINTLLAEPLSKIRLTPEQEQQILDIIQKNINKRNEMKSRKGIK